MAKQNCAIPDALKYFDDLPDSAHVDAEVLAGLLGCEVVTIWRMAADGRLSKPRKLSSRMSRWNVGQVRADIPKLNAPPMRPMKRRLAKAA